jgi:hypothetical protein
MTMRRFVLLALLAASLAGCDRSAGLPIHLADDPQIRREVPFITWGGVVFLDGVPRQVLSSSAPEMPASEILQPTEGQRKVRAQIPPSFSPLPWLVFETVAVRGDQKRSLRSWPVTAKLAGNTYEVFVTENKIQADETPAVRLWPMPDLASRDVETGDVVVPKNAALQVGVGLEPISLDTTIFPVDMTVTAVAAGGATTTLWTQRLDPRDRAHKNKWVDATIPLDAVAGQRVRFRFTARPSTGPTGVPTLPLWADPTIVDAATTTAGS